MIIESVEPTETRVILASALDALEALGEGIDNSR